MAKLDDLTITRPQCCSNGGASIIIVMGSYASEVAPEDRQRSHDVKELEHTFPRDDLHTRHILN